MNALDSWREDLMKFPSKIRAGIFVRLPKLFSLITCRLGKVINLQWWVQCYAFDVIGAISVCCCSYVTAATGRRNTNSLHIY